MTGRDLMADKILPIGTVVLAIIAIWYAASRIPQRAVRTRPGGTRGNHNQLFGNPAAHHGQERPVLPAPHQVLGRVSGTDVFRQEDHLQAQPRLPRLDHAVLDAGRLCHGHAARRGCWRSASCIPEVLDKSLLPWIIASQTIPILAIAPMIIIVSTLGVQGLIPKAFDLDLSGVLPGRHRHGEGAALARSHAS
jgi:NitT/TauT family transport system permease protein